MASYFIIPRFVYHLVTVSLLMPNAAAMGGSKFQYKEEGRVQEVASARQLLGDFITATRGSVKMRDLTLKQDFLFRHPIPNRGIIVPLSCRLQTGEKYYTVSLISQSVQVAEKKEICLQQIQEEEEKATPETRCSRTWDMLMCWPPTPNGTVATQPCPSYINLFKVHANASRRCTENGTWWSSSATGAKYNLTGWTNFTECKLSLEGNVPALIKKHMARIRLLYNVGYMLSLVSLVAAIITMGYFRMLHCPRNILHINLFVSFLLRATISLLKENLLVKGLGLPKDVKSDGQGGYFFSEEVTHWECKLFFTVFNYFLACNYIWIFVEGMYLHTVIFVTVFSENNRLYWYIVFGWVSPLTFIIPWVVVKALQDNFYCWNVHLQSDFFWIINAPLTCTVIINFVFFLNILRVLFTKLNTSNNRETQKYRKLGKSTLVLIPLFGVHYIVFVCLPYGLHVSPCVELVKIYFEMLFNSFGGLLVALLFCFLNEEVQTEIRKRYQRYQLRRGSFRCNWQSASTKSTHMRIEEKNSVSTVNGNTSGGGAKLVPLSLLNEDQNDLQFCLAHTTDDLSQRCGENRMEIEDQCQSL